MAKPVRRPAASYSKPHPTPHKLDQQTCRAILAGRRTQSAHLAKQATKSSVKGLTRWNDVTCLWELTDAGVALAAAPDIQAMTN